MADPVRAAPPGPRRTITVQGNGLVSAEPDQVVLRFDVAGFDPSLGATIEDLDSRVDALRRSFDAGPGHHALFLERRGPGDRSVEERLVTFRATWDETVMNGAPRGFLRCRLRP
jgi:hypothetical protein